MAFSTTPSEGADRLRATSEGQTINALGGNDWIRSTFSGSTLYGGLGHDRITVTLAPPPVGADFTGSAALFGGNGNDWLMTEVTGSLDGSQALDIAIQQSGGRGNDNLYVSAIAETEFGTEGSYDIDLSGGAGDDNIWAEIDASNDHADVAVDAGSGSDIVYIYAPGGGEFGGGATINVDGGTGDDDVTTQAQGTDYGDAGSNTLSGGDGNDRLDAYVYLGSNTLDGGEGDDTLIGDAEAASDAVAGAGNIARGGEGDDTILLRGAVSAWQSYVTNEAYGDAGDDTIESVAQLGSGTDSEYGTATVLLYGGTGNDTLTATTRYDVTTEELGGATLYGGEGNDILRVDGGVENVLNGGSGNDTITGGSGNDRIIGGSGADILRSGGGEDAFVYLWTTGIDLATRDTIRGFGFGDDVIDLSAIDANANQRGNQAFTFGGGTGIGRAWVEDNATGTGSVIRANTGGAEQLYINVEDGTGRDASDWTADDFLL